MASLVIDLQDGFSDDTVVISVDGQEVFRKPGVSTDYSIGLAESVKCQVSEGSVSVEVTIPTRRFSDSISLQISTAVYLGVSVLDEGVGFRTSNDMFLYF